MVTEAMSEALRPLSPVSICWGPQSSSKPTPPSDPNSRVLDTSGANRIAAFDFVWRLGGASTPGADYSAVLGPYDRDPAQFWQKISRKGAEAQRTRGPNF